MSWLTLIILLIFLVILCWCSIHQQYKYQPYTWVFCFYEACTPIHRLQKN
ncbi:hypothetical protein [Cynomolgus macaque cytomegalovirus strain Mauritius]|uniref:Uncharacterized protein n=1 Tax=Cynomolgus macaque cytomegalovirus strain Mauritius TaxID=1690255 RepID=A0A0K1H0C2_9BETA|nr:hypothetical protein [Cynomolgus macaque cytomegalovirus strain Mauritius]